MLTLKHGLISTIQYKLQYFENNMTGTPKNGKFHELKKFICILLLLQGINPLAIEITQNLGQIAGIKDK